MELGNFEIKRASNMCVDYANITRTVFKSIN